MIKFDNVTKTFGTGVSALEDVSLDIASGEFVFLVGPSGAGKTTFFRLLIRDMVPTKGIIMVDEWDLAKLSSGKVPLLRKKIGVVFQDLKLLNDRTIFENIVLPLEMGRMDRKQATTLVEAALGKVGILEHKNKFPVQLSGGELQRTAIARAIIFSPEILLADEPTGNLDADNSWEIVKLLEEINRSGTLVIMATHNHEIINKLEKRVITLDKGHVTKDIPGPKAKPKEEKPAEKEKPAATEEAKEEEKK